MIRLKKDDPMQVVEQIERFIRQHLRRPVRRMMVDEDSKELLLEVSEYAVMNKSLTLDAYLETVQEPSFRERLFGFIDGKGLTDPEVYRKAGIDRRLFSRIRSQAGYRPSKRTALALAFALELDEQQADQLLMSAGYAFSFSDKEDLIVLYFIREGIYDLDMLNMALDRFQLEPIGVG